MIVALCGKGGVGKTSLSALILDELARRGYAGRVLAVDGDPATTLHLALGWPEPRATVAEVLERWGVPYGVNSRGQVVVDPGELGIPTVYGLGAETAGEEAFPWSEMLW